VKVTDKKDPSNSSERYSRIKNSIKTRIKQNKLTVSPLIRLNTLAILVGIVGGFGSWVFRITIDVLYFIFFLFPIELFRYLGLSAIDWLPFLLAPIIGGLIVGILTSRVSKEVKGHGVPEVLESVALHDGKMNLRVPFIKIIASATTIGSGGSAGREGPIAQIGAGFASGLGEKLKLSPKEMRTLVIAGVAAGIASTFNAPIGGALFAIEVLMREGIVTALFIPIIVAAVVGVVTGQILLGTDAPAFVNFPPLEYHDPALIPLVIVLGLLCGVASALWIKGFYKGEDLFESFAERRKIPEFIQPALGGLFVGLILTISYFALGDNWEQTTIMGRTYLPMEAVFDGSLLTGTVMTIMLLLLTLLILKILATILTVGSGGSGGVFAPTLFIGVMLGGLFGIFVTEVFSLDLNIALFALLGMAAFFAGTGRAPLTAIIMTAEMTNDYFLTIPLMFVVAISWLLSINIENSDIYVLKLTRRGVKLREPVTDLLDTITIEDAMIPRDQLIVVDKKTRLESVLEKVRETGHEGFPVVKNEEFVGVITLLDIQRALHEKHPQDWIVGDVLDLKKRRLFCMNKTANLSQVIHIMERHDISRIPVVEIDSNNRPLLIGWLTKHDINRMYVSEKALAVLEEQESFFLDFDG